MLDVSRSALSALTPVRSIGIDLVQPDRHQARRHFDSASLEELAASIRESGVIQPIVVRPRGSGYELIAGERRWRASQLAGLHEIPAIVRTDLTEDECVVFGLVENLQRESLSPVDSALGIQRLCEVAHLTHAQVGERIGKSREYVTGLVRLLSLVQQVADMVNRGELSTAHGKLIAMVPRGDQLTLASEAVLSRMTVRTLERRVMTLKGSPGRGFVTARRAPRSGTEKSADLRRFEARLSDLLGAQVVVDEDRPGHGKLSITFTSLDELSGLAERLGYRDD